MRGITKLLALGAIAISAVVALPTTAHDLTARDPTNSLVTRAEPICFPSDHLPVPTYEITSAVDFFCAISDNHVLARHEATSTDGRTTSTNDKLYISVTNTWCDVPVTLDKDSCTAMFDKIVDSCQILDSKNVGGTVQDECGLWQIQPGV